MKSDGEIMEILAAYDLTGSLRATAELTGCSHHTVARHVAARDAGRPIAEPAARDRVTDAFLPKIEEWVEASKGRIRADKAHEKLIALGYEGSERSTRRAVAQVKAAWRLGHVRVKPMVSMRVKGVTVLLAAAALCAGCSSPGVPGADSASVTGDPYDVYRAEDIELVIYSQKAIRVKCLSEKGYPEFEGLLADGPSDETRKRLAVSSATSLFKDATDAATRGFGFPREADPGSVIVHDPAFEQTFLECDNKGWQELGTTDATLHNDYISLSNRLVTSLMNGTGSAIGSATGKIAQCLVDQGKPVTVDPNSNWGISFGISMGTNSAPEPAPWKPKQTSGVELRPSHAAVPYVPTAAESELASAYYECSVSTKAREEFDDHVQKVKQEAIAKEESQLAELNPKIEELAKKAANLSA